MTANKTFKDFLVEDLSVFFNPEEFAEEHEFEGTSVLMVVVDDDAEDKQGLVRAHADATDDVYVATKTLYIQEGLVRRPRNKVPIMLDGVKYFVEHTNVSGGILKIVLTKFDA